MDAREKLIEIIQSATNGTARYWAELIANKLLAEGVTITPSEQIRAAAMTELADSLKKYFNALNGGTNSNLVAYHIDQVLQDKLKGANND